MPKNVDFYKLFMQADEQLDWSDEEFDEMKRYGMCYGTEIIKEPFRPVYDLESDEAVYGYNPYDA